jgi:uncharacterized protein (DUF433 family)
MHPRIEIDPHRCHGKPVVAGTRTPVSVVLGALAAGDSIDEIARDYAITPDDIRACVAFAREEIDRQSFVPLSA